jgi:uncharacterized caspase-like protein
MQPTGGLKLRWLISYSSQDTVRVRKFRLIEHHLKHRMKNKNLFSWPSALFTVLLFFTADFCMAQQPPKVALVIGNAAYKSKPLNNPENDAKDFAKSLKGFGFTVIERTNLTTKQIGPMLREFRSKLVPGSVAVIFYAGHGLQIKGENYLPTVDADIQGEEDVPQQSLSTRQLMDVLAESGTRMNLVFLDACRNNPYSRRFRSTTRGLSRENAPSGTLISFATRPGSEAADGDGRNGLYTSVLLQQLKLADQPIEQVLKKVVAGVKQASNGQQEPWIEGSIEGDFCFAECGGTSNVRLDADDESWEIAKKINTVAGYQAYLANHPTGRHKSAAEVGIKALGANVKNPPKTPDLKWVKLLTAGPDAGKDAGATFYLNSSTVTKDSPVKKFDLMENFPTPISIGESTMKSVILKMEFNCTTSMVRVVTIEMMSGEMGTGNLFNTEKGDTWRANPSEFHMLPPLVCKK